MDPGFFPFFVPPFGHYPQQAEPENLIPPRVRVAMALLNRLQQKTAPVVAPHGVGCAEVIGEYGQKLTHEETQAQCAALALLTVYFSGQLVPCVWDDHPEPQQNVAPADARKMPCPQCVLSGRTPQGCPMCGGHGVVLVPRGRQG